MTEMQSNLALNKDAVSGLSMYQQFVCVVATCKRVSYVSSKKNCQIYKYDEAVRKGVFKKCNVL